MAGVHMKSDVTAIVPTMGEETLSESIASLKAQSLMPADIVVIRNVSPFVEAMNRGVQQVMTPFLIQCDADMILDSDCIETLRDFMEKDTGVAIGYLHDPMLGIIQAVKLYRTAYLKKKPFEDSVTSDSDRIGRMKQEGIHIAFARRAHAFNGHEPDVLGCHRPNYDDPLYVYGKFSVMGSAVRNRNSWEEYEGVLEALKKSEHPMANLALTSFCHGVFTARRECGHKPFEESDDYRFIREFSKQRNSWNRLFAITRLKGFDPAAELARFYGK
jgi:glycosyltransferase involved in cell wall biosynthesis